MKFPHLFLKEIPEPYARENFKRLENFFFAFPFVLGEFKLFEIELVSAVTNLKYPHGFTFAPKDVLLLHNSENATVTWNYKLFDKDNLNLTTSGATILRAFVGRYENG